MHGNNQLEINSLCSFSGPLFPDHVATYNYLDLCNKTGLFQCVQCILKKKE